VSHRGNIPEAAHLVLYTFPKGVEKRRVSRQVSAKYKYIREKFLGPDHGRMLEKYDMGAKVVYPYCSAGRRKECSTLKPWGGIIYSKNTIRDKHVAIKVSPSKTKIAVYAFGNLYIYDVREDTKMHLLKTHKDIFYKSRDHIMSGPSLKWSPDSKRVAVSDAQRLIRIVNVVSGGVKTVLDMTMPIRYVYYYRPGRRGVVFLSNETILYGNLKGELTLYNYRTSVARSIKSVVKYNSGAMAYPDIVGKLYLIGKKLIIYHGGVVAIENADGLADESRKELLVEGRIGTDVGVQWSRLLHSLDIPYKPPNRSDDN
jgi:hypothetical protein